MDVTAIVILSISNVGAVCWLMECVKVDIVITFTWESSECLLNQSNSRLYQDNLHFALEVLLSVNNFTKVELLCQFFGVPIISKSTFHSYQRNYIYPAINKYYTAEQVFKDWMCLYIGITCSLLSSE